MDRDWDGPTVGSAVISTSCFGWSALRSALWRPKRQQHITPTTSAKESAGSTSVTATVLPGWELCTAGSAGGDCGALGGRGDGDTGDGDGNTGGGDGELLDGGGGMTGKSVGAPDCLPRSRADGDGGVNPGASARGWK